MIRKFIALIGSVTAAAGQYDMSPVEVSSGATLTVTYPPNLVDTLDGGNIKANLGNFGHI
jgi:hypothetical protein